MWASKPNQHTTKNYMYAMPERRVQKTQRQLVAMFIIVYNEFSVAYACAMIDASPASNMNPVIGINA